MPTPDEISSRGQASSVQPYDEKVDIWAVGVLVYEMLSGKPPFEVENPKETAKLILQVCGSTSPFCLFKMSVFPYYFKNICLFKMSMFLYYGSIFLYLFVYIKYQCSFVIVFFLFQAWVLSRFRTGVICLSCYCYCYQNIRCLVLEALKGRQHVPKALR